MDPRYTEKVKGTKADELRIGIASWDEVKKGGSGKKLALKYAWPDKNGRIARGGEVPMVALPQSIEFAIATEAIDVAKVLEAVARGYRRIGTVTTDAG
jgi:hypothetical protein